MTALLRYDAARRAVAEAKTFDEVRDWEDKAAAMQEYCRRARDRTMELDAMEIRADARRRRGQLLLDLKARGHLYEGQPGTVTERGQLRATLDDLGISRNESARDQKIAALDDDSYTRLIARCRTYAEAHPEKHSTFDVLRAPEAPVNGSRSVMSSRHEPDDSLDYFPTPPWATRALIERVFAQLGVLSDCARLRAWDPACGEGHMTAPLAEYFRSVIGSDVFDYSVDGRAPPGWHGITDFLNPGMLPLADWIITNPPFGDKTEAFVLSALDLARIGVAMFVRLQWLETIGRYERLFRDRPPTLIAFFCERVNLCKGRWEPNGTTATAYIWLVWIKGRAPQAPYWIPPGCRESLMRPDDAARFTAHPVISQASCVDVIDPETGEILASDAAQVIAPTIPPENPLLKQPFPQGHSPLADDEIPKFLPHRATGEAA